jgi:hypothetical protein
MPMAQGRSLLLDVGCPTCYVNAENPRKPCAFRSPVSPPAPSCDQAVGRPGGVPRGRAQQVPRLITGNGPKQGGESRTRRRRGEPPRREAGEGQVARRIDPARPGPAARTTHAAQRAVPFRAVCRGKPDWRSARWVALSTLRAPAHRRGAAIMHSAFTRLASPS